MHWMRTDATRCSMNVRCGDIKSQQGKYLEINLEFIMLSVFMFLIRYAVLSWVQFGFDGHLH